MSTPDIKVPAEPAPAIEPEVEDIPLDVRVQEFLADLLEEIGTENLSIPAQRTMLELLRGARILASRLELPMVTYSTLGPELLLDEKLFPQSGEVHAYFAAHPDEELQARLHALDSLPTVRARTFMSNVVSDAQIMIDYLDAQAEQDQ